MHAACIMLLRLHDTVFFVLALLSVSHLAQGYIPAQASNTQDPLAVSSGKQLQLVSGPSPQLKSASWNPIDLTCLDVGSNSTAKPSGALSFYFDYADSSSITNSHVSLPPWIAFISCDKNTTTNTSRGDSLVDLADIGVVAIVLYSQESTTCILNASYRDTSASYRRVSIYALPSKDQYPNVLNAFQTYAPSFPVDHFNAASLSSIDDEINTAINMGRPEQNTFLMATIINKPPHSTTNGSQSSFDSFSTKIIAGSVCGAFALIVGAMAITAYQKSRRHGSRPGNGPLGLDQLPTQDIRPGISRPVLDTFTVVRFRAPDAQSTSNEGTLRRIQVGAEDEGDDFTQPPPYEEYHTSVDVPAVRDDERQRTNALLGVAATSVTPSMRQIIIPAPIVSAPLEASAATAQPAPAPSIGYDTCALCIGAFRADEQLRVLPCSGGHQFHQTCIDPWLLNISPSCPLCRQDFSALERSLLRGGVGVSLAQGGPHP